ncbi:hypothetical protein AN639_12910 [Candidatus Epulonipiscium fishelsonii]|uniref:Uncharacterized protein n=1 Tax=Candidatus Epulonipiscium fishelsonii TaxID=77094 RepID=A0ACC8XDW8_9FIRM|nr:hypothetical protein AN396_04895 [Epulopiscium sp. SCG-B11WGA-EpuloA1]ONI42165.1 hypothetical protein AN639_12910 [Epulopiscium sp. SCG-B05WGA-EpuloA1]
MEFKRGQVYIANLGKDVVGSEQGGIRPVVILQNNIGNKYSPNIICIPFSTKKPKKILPTHIYISKDDYTEVRKDSIILADQIKTISKERILQPTPITVIRSDAMKKIEESVKTSLALNW